jgi:hypothetical protein
MRKIKKQLWIKSVKVLVFWFFAAQILFSYYNSFCVNSYFSVTKFWLLCASKDYLKSVGLWFNNRVTCLPPFQQMCGALAINILRFFSLFQPTPGTCDKPPALPPPPPPHSFNQGVPPTQWTMSNPWVFFLLRVYITKFLDYNMVLT